MILNRLSGLPDRVRGMLTNLGTRDIYLISDKANWAFYWVSHYLTEGLKEHSGLRARMTDNPWKLKNQIIHFVDRYTYLNGPFRSLHPTNHVFLTWFHGDPGDPNPDMQRLLSVVPEAATYIKKIIVTCQISRETLIELGIPEAQIVTIPLGVDLKRFFPRTAEYRLSLRSSLGIPKDAVCIGSFQKDGTGWEDGLEPKLVKGPDVFLEVIANISAHCKKLFILLTGPARGYVKQGLEKMGIPYIHHYLADYHDIVSYYHTLDLYIITSRSEGGPKALLESWATGVPVVSTKVGMGADLIEHGNNGLLADVGDVKGITNHAMALIQDTSLRTRYSHQALEDVKPYSWPLIAEQHCRKLYMRSLT